MRTPAQEAARVDPQDPQRKAVYDWEDAWGPWGLNSLSLNDCRDWIEGACKLYGVEAPEIREHLNDYSWCDIKLGVISMQGGERGKRGGMNCAIALHEAAHWIVFKLFEDRPQDHGPTFFGVYVWLLENSRIAPREALHASARAFGIKWRKLDPETCKN